MNKKSILGSLAILVVAAVAARNVNFNSQTDLMSDVALANVEALANYESGSGSSSCFKSVSHDPACSWKIEIKYCGGCIKL